MDLEVSGLFNLKSKARICSNRIRFKSSWNFFTLMTSKILVPYDASVYSNEAFSKAIEIAKKFNAKLEVLSVLKSDVKGKEVITLERAIEIQDEQEDIATKILKNLEKTAKEEGIDFSFEAIFDPDPAKGIVNFANKHGFDLIVIGSHGRTGLRKRILGSVAYGVVEHAKCPVLIIKVQV